MAVADDLRFGTEYHRWVLEQVLARRDFSREKRAERYDKWRRDDEAMVAYIPEKDAEAKRRQLRDSGEPQFTTLKIPFDYAVSMSMHTYMTSVFLSRNPILQYQGRTGQGQNSAIAVESLMDYQMQVGRMVPSLYVWLLDPIKYGEGFIGSYWDEQMVVVNEEVETPDMFLGVDLGTSTKELVRRMIPGYMGNKIYNIRPYDAFPDPRVTLTDLQNGEFFGRQASSGWNHIVRGAHAGRYFNLQHIRKQNRSTAFVEEGSTQITYPVRAGSDEISTVAQEFTGSVELLEMYIELIPRDWRLGDSDFPEKWVFVVANDTVVIGAQPLGLTHNKYPVYAIEVEIDGYALFKRSMLEIVGPMTDVLTWLFNTHFYNTRKSLNDMFVIDPSKVVMKDVLDPAPGKVIRLKEELYGQDVRSAIYQFPVNNVTQQHLQDAGIVNGLIQRVSGVNDAIMGLAGQGGRRTATEVRTSSTFGINRLKTTSEWISATGFADMATSMLQATQQLMSQPLKVRIAGDLLRTTGGQAALTVNPQDIQGFYDFNPVDGTLPVDRFAQVTMWTQLLQQMAQAPAVLQQYDLSKIFAFVAQLAGLKNIHQFRIDVQSPEALAQQAAAGNVVPLESRRGGGGNRPREAGGPPVASTAPGVGVAG